jgi:translocator protein
MIAAAKTIPSFGKLIIAILICEVVGFTSGLLSQREVNTWFNTLNKPDWNPPAYLFGPVWASLYFLMGISLWLAWIGDTTENRKRNAVIIFGIQLFLNFWWSIIFFKFYSPGIALFNILLMVILIAITIYYFYFISRLAAWLLVPYIAWVGFATVLNYNLWWMNR